MSLYNDDVNYQIIQYLLIINLYMLKKQRMEFYWLIIIGF